jgi:hypothetical protein
MPRPHRRDASGSRVRTVRLSARIPEPLMLELQLLYCDPSTGHMRYGRWGAMLEHILREWINSQKAT